MVYISSTFTNFSCSRFPGLIHILPVLGPALFLFLLSTFQNHICSSNLNFIATLLEGLPCFPLAWYAPLAPLVLSTSLGTVETILFYFAVVLLCF